MFENREVRLEMRRHATENEEMALLLYLKSREKNCYKAFLCVIYNL
jgi:hypothetical protein